MKSQVHVPEKKTTTSTTKQAESDDDILNVGDQPELLEGQPPNMQTTAKNDDEEETSVMSTGLEKGATSEMEKMEVDATKTDDNDHDKPATGTQKDSAVKREHDESTHRTS